MSQQSFSRHVDELIAQGDTVEQAIAHAVEEEKRAEQQLAREQQIGRELDALLDHHCPVKVAEAIIAARHAGNNTLTDSVSTVADRSGGTA